MIIFHFVSLFAKYSFLPTLKNHVLLEEIPSRLAISQHHFPPLLFLEGIKLQSALSKNDHCFSLSFEHGLTSSLRTACLHSPVGDKLKTWYWKAGRPCPKSNFCIIWHHNCYSDFVIILCLLAIITMRNECATWYTAYSKTKAELRLFRYPFEYHLKLFLEFRILGLEIIKQPCKRHCKR